MGQQHTLSSKRKVILKDILCLTITFQVLLITDGNTGVGPMSLKESFATLNQRTQNNPFPIPFAFPAKLHVVCITQANDPVYLKCK